MASNFSNALDSIVSQASEGILQKEAAAAPPRVLTGDDSKAMAKVAELVRNVSVEPSYEDLHAFIARYSDGV